MKINKRKSNTTMIFFFLGKNYKIEFILDNVARVESRAFSLPVQSVSSGGSSGGGGGGISSGSSSGSSSSSSSSSGSGGSSRASTVGTAAQTMTTAISCLMGRVLLLEIFMAAVLTLNINLGKHSWFFMS